jgi:hypothetical protein
VRLNFEAGQNVWKKHPPQKQCTPRLLTHYILGFQQAEQGIIIASFYAPCSLNAGRALYCMEYGGSSKQSSKRIEGKIRIREVNSVILVEKMRVEG